MGHQLPPPRDWLAPVAAHLRRDLVGRAVEGCISGSGWLSLRIGGAFVWMMARGELRVCFLGTNPFPARWLDLLERHDRSPFAGHLRGLQVTGARPLATGDGTHDGLEVTFDRGRVLRYRVWPRPGAIWLEAAGEPLARLGRMEGPTLVAMDDDVAPDDAFGDRASLALRTHLADTVAVTLQRRWRERAARSERLVLHLRRDRDRAATDQDVRATADLLAAHLHQVPARAAAVSLTGFDGEPVEIALDPALDPAANLARLYKRAAKAERATLELGRRLAEAERQAEADARELPAPWPDQLEELLALADERGLDVTPGRRRRGAARRDTPRLPYLRYQRGEDWEIRVGRSAKDNDALLRDHSTGHDLWLHAQGVEGSHVLIRTAGREVPKAVLQAAARLAAHYSKARTSSTAAVLVTPRRYVRKPRKAATGSVVAERGKTVFVEPGIPDDCERVAQGQSEPRRR